MSILLAKAKQVGYLGDMETNKAVEQTMADNQWGGMDYAARSGVARWTNEDGHRKVHAFTPNMIGLWTVSIDASAPEAIFDATLDVALEGIGYTGDDR